MEKKEKGRKKSELSQMSGLLLSGATMLGEACPDCKVPLFKQNDNVFCPQCERKAVYVKDKTEMRKIEQNLSLDESTLQLREILTGKMNFLANQLASADDPQQIMPILEMIEKILLIIQKMS
ncbi:MAG: Sjogren's syndrome/scleroderma autoantigen 1 family protein [Candidatus Hodarchaeales archaeon]